MNNKPEIVAYCDLCGEPIYEGDTYYEIESWNHCEECIRKAKREAFKW